MNRLYLCAFLLLPFLAVAQECPPAQYQKLLKEADAASKKGDFKLAINKLNSAKTCQPTKGDEVDKKILAVFDEVNKQREKAEQNEKEAKRQKELAQKNAKEADAQRKKVEVQRDSTIAQRKVADQEKSNALRQARAAKNLALVAIARDTNPTFALQAAYYNRQAHPENTNAAVAFAQLYGDSILGFYSETKKYHRGYVLKLAMADQGKKLLSVGEYANVNVRDLASDKVTELFRFPGQASNIGVAVSPDAKSIVMGLFSQEPFFWNEKEGFLRIPNADASTGGMAFSPNGQYFAIGGPDNSILILSNPGLKLKQQLKGHQGGIRALAFSPDSKYLLSGSNDKSIILWDIERGTVKQTMKGHLNHPTTLAFSPDGKRAASGSFDKTVKIWDLQNGQLVATLDAHKNPVLEVAFSPDGAWLLTASGDGQALLWDAETLKMKRKCLGHGGPVSSIVFTPDSKMFYTGARDGSIRRWDIARNLLFRTYPNVKDASFSDDSRNILLGNKDASASIRRVETDSLLHTIDCFGTSPVAYLPDKKSVWIGKSLWDIKTGKEIRWFNVSGLEKVAISPDGKTALLAANLEPEKLVDLTTRNVVHTFTEHQAQTNDIDFTSSGKQLLLAGSDVITVWDVSKKALVFQRSTHDAVLGARFSPDGRTIVAGFDGGAMELMDAATGKTIREFPDQPFQVNNVGFSPDGKSIVSGKASGNMTVWDIASGLPLQSFPISTVKTVFAPDGDNLLATSTNGPINVQLWRTYTWILKHRIQGYSFAELHEKGVQLEPEALLQLWEAGGQLTSDELKLIGKTASKR